MIAIRANYLFQVHFLRPDKRSAWKAVTRLAVPPQLRLLSDDERTDLLNKVEQSTCYQPHLFRLLRKPWQTRREKSPEPINPFVVVSDWPDDAPSLPLTTGGSRNLLGQWCIFLPDMSPEPQTFYNRKIKVDHVKSAGIEKRTRLQSSGTEWKQHRCQRITSTFSKRVVTGINNVSRGREERRKKLALEIIRPLDISHIPHIKRGSNMEPVAVEHFITVRKEMGESAKCYPVGFVVHPTESWLGASPDRLVKITDDHTGQQHWCLLEVKTYDPEKNIESLSYLKRKTDTSGVVNTYLCRNHAHYYQVQTALLCTGFEKSFFFVFASNSVEYFLEEISADHTVQNLILPNGSKFYFEHLLEELIE